MTTEATAEAFTAGQWEPRGAKRPNARVPVSGGSPSSRNKLLKETGVRRAEPAVAVERAKALIQASEKNFELIHIINFLTQVSWYYIICSGLSPERS